MRIRIKTTVRLLLGLALAGLLASCGIMEEEDRAPDRPVDFSSIPDAVPRSEARSRYGNPQSYVVNGKRYYVLSSGDGYVERGIASWYGEKFHGRRTSNQEVYDMYTMTAAHKSLPLPAYAEVTNLKNGRQVVVRVNDRGPFHANRVIDLSYVAAGKLGIVRKGTGLVEVRVISATGSRAAKPPFRPVRPKVSVVDLFLQVGAFSNRDNAVRIKSRIHSAVQAAIRIQEVVADDQLLYRVRLGPLAGVEEADRLVEQLARLGIRDPHIIVE
ncbi:MAG: septal ring lytic transglycosylase RlpA family protein [Gammaproteobacteria bacterium]|nr:septal ring lytic transglycosylase RlpA family protein [Gammaproteobacteria bacterium]